MLKSSSRLENRSLSTATAATALGVSITTVKRWVDDGVLPAHRTPGGHRKLLMSDVLRLIHDGNLPRADLSRLLPPASSAIDADPEPLRNRFRDAVVEADAGAIRATILGAYHAGVPVSVIADRILSPAMVQLGSLWQNCQIDIRHEHLVSQACVSALYELSTFLEGAADPQRPVALGGAPEHDHASLASLMARLVLLECGWNAIDLGPHTPMSALTAAIDEHAPRLVWLTVTHLHDADEFLRGYREFTRTAEARNVAVALGGRGLTESLRSQLTSTYVGEGFADLSSLARSLHRLPQIPKRGRPAGSKRLK